MSLPDRYIVTIGASAGGVETLMNLVKHLSPALCSSLLIVVHFPAWGRSTLPEILSRAGHLPAKHATDGEQIRPGHLYIAPPDRHMVIQQDVIRLSRTPRENGHRPTIDVTLRSTAQAYGPRAVGVILSGTLDDGTAGLAVIKAHGGVAIVQDPQEAIFDGMPQSAINHVPIYHILNIEQIAHHLNQLEC